MKKQKVKSTKQHTISFIIHSMADSYGQTLFSGIADAASRYNVNLLCFVGRDLKSPRGFESQANLIYHLAKPRGVDGIIISGSTVGNFITQQEWEVFYKRYHSLPLISIAVPVQDLPSIVIDNKEAMTGLVRHLVQDHRYRRIAYVSGPQHNVEEFERYQGYQEVLSAAGILLEPTLVVEGDFEFPSGYEAVRILMDERKIRFDALVASNDNMALGAIEALTERGIKVPQDVAVVGFDDIPMSATITPPLTTLHQPIYEMGEESVKLMCDMIKGKKIIGKIPFPTKLVVRESCGCYPFATSSAIQLETRKDLDHEQDFQKEKLIAHMKGEPTIRSLFLNGKDLNVLVDALSRNLHDPQSTLFIRTLNDKLRLTVKAGKNVKKWQQFITVIWKYAYAKFAGRNDFLRLTELLDQARCLIAEVESRRLYDIRLRFEGQSRTVREISESLVTRFDLDELIEVIHTELMRIEIKTFYLILYEGAETSSDAGLTHLPVYSHLSLAYLEGAKFRLGPQESRFPSNRLVPSRFLPSERYTLIVMPLYFRTEHFGYAVFQYVPSVAGLTYEALRDQISSALKGSRLYREMVLAKEETEYHSKKLEESNRELQEFAYIASHDLQEPLRMISSYLGLIERRYNDKLDKDGKEFIDYAVDGAKRLQVMINDLLQYSRVTTKGKPFEKTDMEEVLEKVLMNLKIAVEESGGAVTHDQLPEIMADQVQMERLFQNLLGNAIKYHGDRIPEVHISVKRNKEEYEFSIQDNGIGIQEEYREKIFRIFQRLHTREEYQGTGIGLAVCKKIVERHGGKIWVDGKFNEGSTFYFTIRS